MDVKLEPIEREAPEVRALYEAFICEAGGPLVVGGRLIDLEAELAGGPPRDLVPPNGLLLMARVEGEPAGLGGVRDLDREVAEVKSMFVRPSRRGLGLGRRILTRLEEIAAERGCRAVRLDTSSSLTAALTLYRSAGYAEVPAYNDNEKVDVWLERQL